MKTTQQAFQRFLPYIVSYRLEMIAALLLGIIGGTATVVMTFYTGQGIDTMVGEGRVDFQSLFHILCLLAGILLVTVISQGLVQILGNRIAYQSIASLRKEAFDHLNHLPITYYDQSSHGAIISRFTNDLDVVSEACVAVFNNVFSGMTIVIISLISMLYLSPSLTVIVLVSTPLIFLITWVVAHTSQKYFTEQQKIVGEISGFVTEIIGNQSVVKSFQYENKTQEQLEEMNHRLFVRGQKAQFYSSLTNPLSRFVDHLAYISIGLIGGLLLLGGNGSITIGILSSFTIYSSQFSKPFIELSGITTQIQTALAGLTRIFEIMDEPIEQEDTADSQLLSTISGKVDFHDVWFSYEPQQPLIQDLNLSVNPGETVAIVGKTGAGKSTLVNLLMRFYDVQAGTITIDDRPIQDYQRDALRKSFGMVLQDTWLFDGTVKENLLFGNPEATDEQMMTATKTAKIHSFIQRLPHGYDTVIGSVGVKISEGERQLLTIARTMIAAPPMLILDEATSSVDTLTEQTIQQAFLALMKGRTSFVIAHRLATIRNADTILVMDQGQIVEMGTHDELLQLPHGFYQKLYAAQFKHSDN